MKKKEDEVFILDEMFLIRVGNDIVEVKNVFQNGIIIEML